MKIKDKVLFYHLVLPLDKKRCASDQQKTIETFEIIGINKGFYVIDDYFFTTFKINESYGNVIDRPILSIEPESTHFNCIRYMMFSINGITWKNVRIQIETELEKTNLDVDLDYVYKPKF